MGAKMPQSWGPWWKIHPWSGWRRRSRAPSGGAGAEGLTGSVCSRSLVTKEKGTALGKETKHPLPSRVISFPRAALQPSDPRKAPDTGRTASPSRVAESKRHRVSVTAGDTAQGRSSCPHHLCPHHPFPSVSSQSYGKMWGTPGAAVRSIRPYQSSEQYLYAMKEDLAEWLKELYDLDIEVGTFVEVLETGAVLCSHANKVTHVAGEFARACPGVAHHLRLPAAGVACNLAAQPGTFQARDNVSNFIQWCRKEMDIKGKMPGSSYPVSPCAISLQLLLASPQVPQSQCHPSTGQHHAHVSLSWGFLHKRLQAWQQLYRVLARSGRVCLGANMCWVGGNGKGRTPQRGPAMHSMILAVRTSSGAVLALSKGPVTLSPPPAGAQEGHGVTRPQHIHLLGFVIWDAMKQPLRLCLKTLKGKALPLNLSQSLLDPAIFLAGWLQEITSLWVGFDSACAPPVPFVPVPTYLLWLSPPLPCPRRPDVRDGGPGAEEEREELRAVPAGAGAPRRPLRHACPDPCADGGGDRGGAPPRAGPATCRHPPAPAPQETTGPPQPRPDGTEGHGAGWGWGWPPQDPSQEPW